MSSVTAAEVEEPSINSRVWYRSTKTGDRGYMVKVNGKDYVRLDRPADLVVTPFHPQHWRPDHEKRAMSRAQAAQIAYEADRKICYFTGRHDDAKREWSDMRDDDRIDWVRNGPKTQDPLRRSVYEAMMDVLMEVS